MANMINGYMDMWKNFANFSGRTSLHTYWWTFLANIIIGTVLGFIPYVSFIYSLVSLIPGLALTVRRLNDAGKSWAWIFISLVPLVGWIILILMLCKPSIPQQIVDAR